MQNANRERIKSSPYETRIGNMKRPKSVAFRSAKVRRVNAYRIALMASFVAAWIAFLQLGLSA